MFALQKMQIRATLDQKIFGIRSKVKERLSAECRSTKGTFDRPSRRQLQRKATSESNIFLCCKVTLEFFSAEKFSIGEKQKLLNLFLDLGYGLHWISLELKDPNLGSYHIFVA